MERVIGIEPTLIAWKAIVLPLNYTRGNGAERGTWTLTVFLPQDFKSCASTIPPLQHGVPPETRTPDPFIKSEMLYHWASGTNWLGRVDSNHRMSESKSDALPLGYNPINGGQKWIRTTETVGGWFTVSCVWPLRYLSIICLIVSK